jgi:hypothetical protein
MLRAVLLIFLVLVLLGSLPTWPYSTGWGLLSKRRFGIGCAYRHRVDSPEKTVSNKRRFLPIINVIVY